MAKSEKFQYTRKEMYKEGQKSIRFRTFYEAKLISKDIMKINYSYRKYKENYERIKKQHTTMDLYASGIYEKYNIRQYKNKNEFIRDMFEHGYTNEETDIRWKQYQHRNKLIYSGQYDEYRIKSYQHKYIKAMKAANVNDDIIENIKNLSPLQFEQLSTLRNPATNTQAKYRLPQLGGFDYNIMGINYNDKTKEIEDNIRDTFREAGIPFNEKITAEPIKFVPYETPYTLRSTLKRMFPGQIHYLNSASTEKEYKERAFKLLEEKILSGKKIYKEKNGIATLSFIGQSIPSSKNYTFVYDFKKYINRK